MENPGSINRFLLALLVVATIVAMAASIYFQSSSVLFGCLSALAGCVVVCAVFALLSIATVAPLFRLMASIDPWMGRNKHRNQ
jgi:hypothetical protein